MFTEHPLCASLRLALGQWWTLARTARLTGVEAGKGRPWAGSSWKVAEAIHVPGTEDRLSEEGLGELQPG